MAAQPVRLKLLLRKHHWQTYRTFCLQYDKAAQTIDPELVGSWPSRAQLHRWLSGELKGLPYPDHCRVLEAMFPGWSAAELFELIDLAKEASSARNGGRPPDFARLFEVIESGLQAPDSARVEWGPRDEESGTTPGHSTFLSSASMDGATEIGQRIGRKLVAISKVLRLSTNETRQLASLAGNVVDLDFRIDFDIANDGWARVYHRQEVFNMSERPLTRFAKELWFEHTDGPLKISPVSAGPHRVAIQRVHDTATMSKFACQLSPAVQPGETAVIGYTCEGGQFVSDHYWRQAFSRYTRQFTLDLRHRGGKQLVNATAIKENADGSENSAAGALLWDVEGTDVVITLALDYMRPNQAVTLRWEVASAAA